MNKRKRSICHLAQAKHALLLLVRVAAMLALGLGVFSLAQPAEAESKLECSDYAVEVKLSDGATDVYHVVGTLCSQGPAAGKTVQLLLHGATSGRFNWDFPYQPEHYSYVRSAVKRGYVTFNLDRIGVGASDHPDGNLVDVEANGFVTHQVVEALRAGKVGGTSFAKVIVVGHSLGSVTAANYASRFPGEADGIILTGFLHDMNWDYISSTLMKLMYPATLDPKFAGQFPNYDYFTTVPGAHTIGGLYYMPNVDPALIPIGESLKQTTTIGELNSLAGAVMSDASQEITGPVQIVVGQYDLTFCGNLVNCSDPTAVYNFEASHFGPGACLETEVINDAGHSIHLQLNAGSVYSKMLTWADRHVGSTAGAAPEPCEP